MIEGSTSGGMKPDICGEMIRYQNGIVYSLRPLAFLVRYVMLELLKLNLQKRCNILNNDRWNTIDEIIRNLQKALLIKKLMEPFYLPLIHAHEYPQSCRIQRSVL
jgi:hypothetical protein